MKVITATFHDAEGLMSALNALVEKRHRVMDVHSPYPLEGIEDIIDYRESPVRFWSFICGIIGLVAGFALAIWTSLDWPHYTGGKPIVSLPPFLIIAFELTLLLGAIGTIIGFVFHSRLPSLMEKRHLTGDQFGLTLIEEPDKIKSVESFLSSLGTKEIFTEDWIGALPSSLSLNSGIFASQRTLVCPCVANCAQFLRSLVLRLRFRIPCPLAQKMPLQGKYACFLKLPLAFLIMAILGIASFLIGLSGMAAYRAWQIYLVNLLYWTGISFGGVIFTAILVTTNANWAKGLRTVAVRLSSFILVSLVLFLLTFFGRNEIFPWIGRSLVDNKEKWINLPLIYIRDGLGWLAMVILSIIFMYNFSKYSDSKKTFLSRLAVILIISFMFFFSLIGIDLIMGLSPEWVSTLFGGYFAIGAFYSSLAFVVLFTLISRVEVDGSELRDMGKLIFGFSLFWSSLFWAQYLVIWYGNIPEETGFVYYRLNVFPWKLLSWIVIVLNFFVPFILLLGKHAKSNCGILRTASASIIIGFFLERFVLIAPSLSAKPYFGIMELLISLGFFGVFLLFTIRCASREKYLAKNKF